MSDILDWKKAIENVDMLIPLYEEIGWPGVFGLNILKGLKRRYERGERSENLYNEMMEAE